MNEAADELLDGFMYIINAFEVRTDDHIYANLMRSRVRELRSLWRHRDRGAGRGSR